MTIQSTSIAGAVVLAMFFASGHSSASDHIDGPVTTAHAITDLTDLYAFQTPGKPGFLTLVLNVHPLAREESHFSSRVGYRFQLREALAGKTLITTSRDPKAHRTITVRFNDNGGHHAPSEATFTLQGEGAETLTHTVPIGKVSPYLGGSGAIRGFAGHRADSFFFNAQWAGAVAKNGTLPGAVQLGPKNPPVVANTMALLNTLSVVVEIDVAKVFHVEAAHDGKIPMLAVVAESLGDNDRRMDRVGRPEVTNVTMVAHDPKPDLRDRFNQEDSLFSASNGDYESRILENVFYYDQLDSSVDWKNSQAEFYARLIAHDYLVIDLSQTTGAGYFTIERAILMGSEPACVGGRLLDDDIMDTLFGILIKSPASAEGVSDGIDAPGAPTTRSFPYLAKPNFSLVANLKADLAVAAAKAGALAGVAAETGKAAASATDPATSAELRAKAGKFASMARAAGIKAAAAKDAFVKELQALAVKQAQAKQQKAGVVEALDGDGSD